ncbi:MAG: TonB-dependent receptor [Steroidobacteraceae bacterium]
MQKLRLWSLLATVVALTQTAVLPAQEATEALEEITVTARKQSESLQSVPLTVTAFSEADIERAGLRSLTDLSAFSPGLYYSEQGSQRGGRSESVIRFRGMDTNDITPTRALASAFIDGIYVAGGLSSISLEEVERVEVIKGPQSAYFGRTTFGGAVNFVTRPVSDEFSGRAALTVAEDGEYDVTGSIEGPIIGERLAARLTARYYTRDGRYTSAADGGRLGAEETRSVDGTLAWQPTDTLRIKVRAHVAEDDDGPATTFALTSNYHNCGPFFPGGVTYICGDLPIVKHPGTNTILDPVPYDIYVNNSRNTAALEHGPSLDHLGLRRDTEQYSVSADWSLPSDLTLSFSAAYGSISQRRIMDLDFTPRKIWLEAHFQEMLDRSAELRLSQRTDRLRWMLGLSAFSLDFSTPSGASIGYLYPNTAFPNGFFIDQVVTSTYVDTSAVFGAVSYDLTDQWNLSLEARYQQDKSDQGTVGNTELKKTYTNFLPRVILQWQPSDETNLYVTYAKGNKPGDFNSNLIALTPAQAAEAEAQTGATTFVGEEELDNYEIGLKKSLFDRRVQLNAAVYYMNWLNQQTRTTAVITDLTNPAGRRTVPVTIAAGKTELHGLELEGRWRATPELTIGTTFNWAASEYKEFICGFCQRVTGISDVSGNETPRFPEYSGTVSADYVMPFGASKDWFVRGDLIYTGAAWDEAFNLAQNRDSWRANLRGGVTMDRVRIEAFVTNLFDDDTYLSAARFTDFTLGNFNLNNFVTNVVPADPRKFGLRVSMNF